MADDSKKKHEKKNNDLSFYASQLGSKGGKAGGPARDRALTHEEKVKIAREGGMAKAAKQKAAKAKLKKKGK